MFHVSHTLVYTVLVLCYTAGIFGLDKEIVYACAAFSYALLAQSKA